jgi:hypothetical protein
MSTSIFDVPFGYIYLETDGIKITLICEREYVDSTIEQRKNDMRCFESEGLVVWRHIINQLKTIDGIDDVQTKFFVFDFRTDCESNVITWFKCYIETDADIGIMMSTLKDMLDPPQIPHIRTRCTKCQRVSYKRFFRWTLDEIKIPCIIFSKRK